MAVSSRTRAVRSPRRGRSNAKNSDNNMGTVAMIVGAMVVIATAALMLINRTNSNIPSSDKNTGTIPKNTTNEFMYPSNTTNLAEDFQTIANVTANATSEIANVTANATSEIANVTASSLSTLKDNVSTVSTGVATAAVSATVATAASVAAYMPNLPQLDLFGSTPNSAWFDEYVKLKRVEVQTLVDEYEKKMHELQRINHYELNRMTLNEPRMALNETSSTSISSSVPTVEFKTLTLAELKQEAERARGAVVNNKKGSYSEMDVWKSNLIEAEARRRTLEAQNDALYAMLKKEIVEKRLMMESEADYQRIKGEEWRLRAVENVVKSLKG